MTTADDALIAAAQRYGDELESSRIISGFAARALPLGAVLLRSVKGRPVPDAHVVVRVHGGWWSADAPLPEPLAGDLEFVVLHVPRQTATVRPLSPSRPSWRGRSFLTGPRRTFADGAE